MRKRFEQQLSIGTIPISEYQLDLKSRHQLAPVLKGLQYIFVTPELNEQVFSLLEAKILENKKKTGRNGMALWEILVLGVVKLNLSIDYDFLHNLANSHEEIQGILGVLKSDFTRDKKYNLQTIKDNVKLLDEQTILSISELVVKESYGLIKKKEAVSFLDISVKVDSYVIETDIHFPTDMNLLYDSCRKSLDMVGKLKKEDLNLAGWGQYKKWYNKVRNAYRETSEIHRKKGKDYSNRLKDSAKAYDKVSQELEIKISTTLVMGMAHIASGQASVYQCELIKELSYYFSMLKKHRDLMSRRILLGEQIPHSEKIFSIFEPHTEWNTKGKLHKNVELGHNTVIATDQYNFILYSKVHEKEVDKELTVKIGRSVHDKYSSQELHLKSISFDRNYFSFPAQKELSKLYEDVILPKPGYKSSKQRALESGEIFVKKRKAHSAVESNINQLEHHGLDKCRDKGIDGFKRYVAYGVLSYNLHQMGKLLMATSSKQMSSIAQRA